MENDSKQAGTELVEKLHKLLRKCVLCPHKCKIDRTTGEKGFCGAGLEPFISSAMSHHGEEPAISGIGGSGTIFFSYCNMECCYCQNYQISQVHEGRKISTDGLSNVMISLQRSGCHNINLVSPTIWIPQITRSYYSAIKKGLNIPLVYNTGGYDSPAIIKMLEGVISVFMPDMRYSSNEMAEKYSGIKNYVENNRLSLKEMYRQVGGLVLDKKGIAVKGLLIRLLVLPGNISGIKETLEFIKYELSEKVYLSIMAQYHPEYRALTFPELAQRVTLKEYQEVTDHAYRLGLVNGWVQDHFALDKEDLFRPDFKKKKVFKYYEE